MALIPTGAPAAVFTFTTQSVRVIMIDDAPWFVATDVCNALGIENNRNATARLDDDEKGVRTMDTPSGQQELTIINESGLYSLILGSRKPEAKRFKKWVTAEVLPAIRKTGSYHAAPAAAPDAAHETLAAKDMGNLTRLVWLICNAFWGHQAWTQAVWYRLRQVTGTPAPQRFQVRHLPILAAEVRRIYAMVQTLKDAQRQAERLLIKRVLRGGEAEGPILAQAQQLITQAANDEQAELTRLMSPWEEAEIAHLTERHAPYISDTIAAYAEGAR